MSFGVIYKATNIVNGKVYIGQTIRGLRERKRKHCYATQDCHFHRAIRKYGKDVFIWEVIEECSSQHELNLRETYYIHKYDAINGGYNMRAFGEVQSGWSHSEDTKRKLSIKAKERHAIQGHPNKGKKWSKDVIKRMSEGSKGRVISKEQRKQHSRLVSGKGNPMYGMDGDKCPSAKKFIVTYPNGKKVIVKGLSKFCRDNNLTSSIMYGCAKGRYKQHKGYTCQPYIGDDQ